MTANIESKNSLQELLKLVGMDSIVIPHNLEELKELYRRFLCEDGEGERWSDYVFSGSLNVDGDTRVTIMHKGLEYITMYKIQPFGGQYMCVYAYSDAYHATSSRVEAKLCPTWAHALLEAMAMDHPTNLPIPGDLSLDFSRADLSGL